jgi:hypothetical protein
MEMKTKKAMESYMAVKLLGPSEEEKAWPKRKLGNRWTKSQGQ